VRLGECLVAGGVITEELLGAALARQRATRERIGSALVALGVDADAVARALGEQRGVVAAHDAELASAGAALRRLVPDDVVRRLWAVPVRVAPTGEIVIALRDPHDATAVAELERAVGGPVRAAAAAEVRLRQAIAQALPASTRIPRIDAPPPPTPTTTSATATAAARPPTPAATPAARPPTPAATPAARPPTPAATPAARPPTPAGTPAVRPPAARVAAPAEAVEEATSGSTLGMVVRLAVAAAAAVGIAVVAGRACKAATEPEFAVSPYSVDSLAGMRIPDLDDGWRGPQELSVDESIGQSMWGNVRAKAASYGRGRAGSSVRDIMVLYYEPAPRRPHGVTAAPATLADESSPNAMVLSGMKLDGVRCTRSQRRADTETADCDATGTWAGRRIHLHQVDWVDARGELRSIVGITYGDRHDIVDDVNEAARRAIVR
jgi:hypothetical protein